MKKYEANWTQRMIVGSRKTHQDIPRSATVWARNVRGAISAIRGTYGSVDNLKISITGGEPA